MNSTSMMPGIPRFFISKLRWMHCVVPPGDTPNQDPLWWRKTPRRADPTCCLANQTFSCSTSPPTTSTPSPWLGSNITCANTKALSSLSHMTVTSSTTWQAGSSNSTAAMEFRGKAIILRGSNKKKTNSQTKRRPKVSARKLSCANSNRSTSAPKARQSKGKARVTSYEQLLGQEAEKRREELEIYIPPLVHVLVTWSLNLIR